MMKDAPNNIPINIIGLAQTSCEILDDGDILILLVVLITPNPCGITAPNQDHIIHLLHGF